MLDLLEGVISHAPGTLEAAIEQATIEEYTQKTINMMLMKETTIPQYLNQYDQETTRNLGHNRLVYTGVPSRPSQVVVPAAAKVWGFFYFQGCQHHQFLM